MGEEVITIAHGGGGTRMRELLEREIFPILGLNEPYFSEDAAILDAPGKKIAVTTDSYVVQPIFFPGGDIGKLAICGTVNDLSMRGAVPLFITLGLVLEEGLPLNTLRKVLESISLWAKEANVRIVAGDTKVVGRGQADGLYINTSGVGYLKDNCEISLSAARPGDLLVINGYIGDHGIAVLGGRDGTPFETGVESDCAPLSRLVSEMISSGEIHALHDPTRGGLASALKEMAQASRCEFVIEESSIPIRDNVKAVCEMLGLDPLYVANEGKLLASIPEACVNDILRAMRKNPYGRSSVVIGKVVEGRAGSVVLLTPMGTKKILRIPSGEQLPRIC